MNEAQAVTDAEWLALGRKIAALREERGWTQAQLAAAIAKHEAAAEAAGEAECAPATIARYEHGVIRLSTSRLCAIAEVLGMSAADLVDGVL